MKVITLCGSTRFKNEFRKVEEALTLVGNAVISLGFFDKSDNIPITKAQEEMFAEIHFKKIDLADEIFVIDVNGYIGESTANEIKYAIQHGKAVRYYSKSKLALEEKNNL
ncbi:hypothetical protein [Alkalihalobacillus sp. AL-G]|uniref:hypothetical protein n=1 Tax=Alkalihalobacillus sp. AL-G TaxID=2926399 RepID=UPI00272B7EB8|nr:hypothetical protein [Alkalihalobacillus sp. AL-G]WLD94754.1 hypothetical protein MOJ78_07690 [Alkalihalobacillus sp. AL-G]